MKILLAIKINILYNKLNLFADRDEKNVSGVQRCTAFLLSQYTFFLATVAKGAFGVADVFPEADQTKGKGGRVGVC